MEKEGAWLQSKGESIGQGKEAVRQTLLEKPGLDQEIVQGILTKRNVQLTVS